MVCDGKHLDRTIDAAIDDTERESVECYPTDIWLNKNPVTRRIVTDFCAWWSERLGDIGRPDLVADVRRKLLALRVPEPLPGAAHKSLQACVDPFFQFLGRNQVHLPFVNLPGAAAHFIRP